jgi:hypothetical protein
MNSRSTTTGWVGWAVFAAVIMITVGIFQAIAGLIALFNPNYVVVAPQNLLFLDLASWGWVHLLMGLVIVGAGFAVLNGQVWGRTIGVIMAILSAVANFVFIPAYPIWSVILIVVDFLVIYALIAHGHELRD